MIEKYSGDRQDMWEETGGEMDDVQQMSPARVKSGSIYYRQLVKS